jgi:hypothetical protein
MGIFDNFKPSLSENISCGLLCELWEKDEWRAYVEGFYPDTVELMDQFLDRDAKTVNVFKHPTPAYAPCHTFAWQSNSGLWHQGALYINGAVYRQANPYNGALRHILLIDDQEARELDYPEGWILLSKLEVEEGHELT